MTKYELLVDRTQDGMLVVTNCSDTDVPKGVIFTSLFARRVRRLGEIFEEVPHGSNQSVLLKLEDVVFFNRQFQYIPRGHHAGIRLSGTGFEQVIDRLDSKEKGIQVFLGAAGP